VFHSLSYFSRSDLRFATPPDICLVWSCGPNPARAGEKCDDRRKRRWPAIDSAASTHIRGDPVDSDGKRVLVFLGQGLYATGERMLRDSDRRQIQSDSHIT